MLADWDIVTLSETWYNKKYDDSMSYWPGYYCYRLDRTTRKGGGLACYVKNTLAPFCSLNKNLTVSNGKIECLAVNINKPGDKRMLVCTIYRPPNASVDDFCSELQNIGENTLAETWLAGDYNIDFRKTGSKSFKKINAQCGRFGWSYQIRNITRLNDRGGSTIDNILTNSNMVLASGVHPQLVRDHLPQCTV